MRTRRISTGLRGLLLLVLLLVSAGCTPTINFGSGLDGIAGSGNVETESYDVANIRSVTLSGVGNLLIEQTGEESLTVTADDNILPLIIVDQNDGALTIGFEQGRSVTNVSELTYRLTVEDLEAVTLSGAGNVEISGLETDSITVTLSGAGNVEVAGRVAHQTVVLSGAGNYDAADLASETVVANNSGLGRIVVDASDTLDATISGAGSIEYSGSPEVTEEVTGLGALVKR